ncbi:MAG: GTPase HflX [Candidatus Bathyarchaeia archaeon]
MVLRTASKSDYNLSEIKDLANSAGYTVVGYIKQFRKADPRYQIGLGKVKELVELVRESSAERVIFDGELKPVQAYNLAKATGVEVIDRLQLILEIFAKRASTLEAKLQIKLAQLTYELSRAKEKVRLAKMGEQPVFSGLGKYEEDVYYEAVRRQVYKVKDLLKRIRSRRSIHRKSRVEKGFSLISLCGYTNSGKSTLFNAFTGGEVPTDSELFTTLSTKTRLINICGRKALITDTVGFIDRLPLLLIDAFHSTLEETIFSDVILLVLDFSEGVEEIRRKLSTCLNTIEKINASGIPIVTALNKIDLISRDELEYKMLQVEAPNPVPVSALKKINLAELERKILEFLPRTIKASVSLPDVEEAYPLISGIFEETNVLRYEFNGDEISVTFEGLPWVVNKMKSHVEEMGGELVGRMD